MAKMGTDVCLYRQCSVAIGTENYRVLATIRGASEHLCYFFRQRNMEENILQNKEYHIFPLNRFLLIS